MRKTLADYGTLYQTCTPERVCDFPAKAMLDRSMISYMNSMLLQKYFVRQVWEQDQTSFLFSWKQQVTLWLQCLGMFLIRQQIKFQQHQEGFIVHCTAGIHYYCLGKLQM